MPGPKDPAAYPIELIELLKAVMDHHHVIVPRSTEAEAKRLRLHLYQLRAAILNHPEGFDELALVSPGFFFQIVGTDLHISATRDDAEIDAVRQTLENLGVKSHANP